MTEAVSRTRRSRAYLLVILAIFFALCGYWYWNYKRTQKREERAYAEELGQSHAVVGDMSSRWNANTGWRRGFKGPLPSNIYTSDVERAVLGDRPILLYGHLDDVRTAGNGYRAELSSLATDWLLHIHYALDCDPRVANNFLSEKRGPLEIFAVVAHVDKVEKRTDADTSYFLVEGAAKEATYVGVNGISLAASN